MVSEFLNTAAKRRSRYNLTDKSPLSQEEITALVEGCLKAAPSAFNSQSSRAVVLFGDNHKKLWSITMETLRALIPADSFEATEKKIAAFAAAYGSVLYFEDVPTTEALQKSFPSYKDNFPIWAQQANGMLQFSVWTVFAENGIGASLQHYNPLIDGEVKKAFNIPSDWKLIAQMPFGEAFGPDAPKEFMPIDTRLKVIN